METDGDGRTEQRGGWIWIKLWIKKMGIRRSTGRKEHDWYVEDVWTIRK